MTNYKEVFKIFSLAIIFSVIYFGNIAHGAELKISTQNTIVTVGSEVLIEINLDTNTDNINALSGNLLLPNDIELKKIITGNSIISLWIETPKISGNSITFSGIIPGGFNGNGNLFSIIISAKNRGQKIINFSNLEALLNDGEGTATNITSKIFEFTAQDEGVVQKYKLDDNALPENFTPEITRDKNLFTGSWFVTFYTQDKQSGIDHFEIAEKRGFKTGNFTKLSWQKSESPYLLKDQELKSYIYIKAVDLASNERVVVVSPKAGAVATISQYKNYIIWVIIIIIIGLIYFLSRRPKKLTEV